jgi:hypothetical protein
MLVLLRSIHRLSKIIGLSTGERVKYPYLKREYMGERDREREFTQEREGARERKGPFL